MPPPVTLMLPTTNWALYEPLPATGYRVPSHYDSLIAKLLVHQPTRMEAIATMRRALSEFRVEGIHTTIALHRDIFNTSAFIEGTVDTKFVERSLRPGDEKK